VPCPMWIGRGNLAKWEKCRARYLVFECWSSLGADVIGPHEESNTVIAVASHGDVEPSCRLAGLARSCCCLSTGWWLINRTAMALTWKC
jgi:hypothetical protein